MDKVRVDKWIWAVRIFKSRSQATDACKSGHVSIDEKKVKPSTLIQLDDIIHIKKDGFNLQFKVIQLIEKRVGAAIADTCKEDLTPEDELHKYKDWFIGKAKAEWRQKGDGRPTKKDRRTLEEFKKKE
jgi:ribosome-associated heat shock protein Hsp15